jgi:hypothetical protein
VGTLGLAPPSTPVWALAGLMVPVGLAGPLIMPPVTAVLLNSVPAHRTGTASGVFNTSRQIGGALAWPSSVRCWPTGRPSCTSAHQPADRRSGGAGCRRRSAAPAPTHDDEGGLMSTWTPAELDGQPVPGTDIGVSSLGGWCIY